MSSEKLHHPAGVQAYRKHFSELAQVIKDPEWLAAELFSENLISYEALDEVITVSGVSRVQKARKLLCHFKGNLGTNPECFPLFMTILKKEKSLHWLANRIEATYSKLNITTVIY